MWELHSRCVKVNGRHTPGSLGNKISAGQHTPASFARIGGVVANAALAFKHAVEIPKEKTRMSHNSFIPPTKTGNLKALAKECHETLTLEHVSGATCVFERVSACTSACVSDVVSVSQPLCVYQSLCVSQCLSASVSVHVSLSICVGLF